MVRVLAAELAILLELNLIRGLLLVLTRLVVLALAITTIQTNSDSHTALLLCWNGMGAS